MNLSGPWAFQLDPQDEGISEQWFNRKLAQIINLPGSLQEQGFGHDVSVDTAWIGDIFDPSWFTDERYARYRQPGHIKLPFWLQPDKRYLGAAWYQREITIPANWRGQRVTLHLERPHWQTRVWLDEQEIGADLSLSTPHVYDLGTNIAPGQHRLTICVDNRMLINVGANAHSMSDHTQGAWNGLVGQLNLAEGSPVWLADIQIFPNVAHKKALVRIKLGNAVGKPGTATLRLRAAAYNSATPHTPDPVLVEVDLPAQGTTVHVEYPLGQSAQLWDEFSPALYRLSVELNTQVAGHTYTDQTHTTFGLREIKVQGTQLALNNRKIFLRGTLECCIFPLTGYPPTDVDAWKRIIQICRAHGLNHIRFHSWCPPEAAFMAADELGFYYQVECPSWANQGTKVGLGQPLDRWLYAEGERISAAYGNHPSFIMMAYGNEPDGNIDEFLGTWVDYWRGHDPRRVYTSGAGWPAIPENQYHNIFEPRIQLWEQELNSRINSRPPETRTDYREVVARFDKPIISHEIGQWCVYPNLAEIDKYTGLLKAKNFEIFRDFLEENHMGDQAHDFLLASGKLQALCYKEEIESALRTPGFAGFQLLDLHDFPGQGTALVGVLDAFWDEKGYISPAQFNRFCNSTVPLARLDKRYWHTAETLTVGIDVAHFGPTNLPSCAATWQLVDSEGAAVVNGQFAPAAVPTGALTRLGAIAVDLAYLTPAQKYTLVVSLSGTNAENDWDIWVFADDLDTAAPDDVLVVEALDQAALAHLGTGGKVLLLPPPATVKTESVIGFSTVFWNTAWTNNQAPHTLGILCNPQHPALAHFPTQYHSNWQWWELVHGAAAMVLNHFPPNLRPLVQPIDTWFEARRLGLLFEARVNGGKLMVCSMDLKSDLSNRLVARQLRYSLLAYMRSEQFNPTIETGVAEVQALFQNE